jgi:hypothetical protein
MRDSGFGFQKYEGEILIETTEYPEPGTGFRFVALCGATRHAGRHAAYRELPCAGDLLVRMDSDQSETLD